MTKHVIITAGPSGVGKTYRAEEYIKHHPEYKLVHCSLDMEQTISDVSKEDYVIMDYYFHQDNNADILAKRLGCEIEIWVLTEDPKVIVRRQIFDKALSHISRVDCAEITSVYTNHLPVLINYDTCKFFDASTMQELAKQEFYDLLDSYDKKPSEKEVLDYVEEMKVTPGYDAFYHYFYLPHGVVIGKEGYARNELTWNEMKHWLDWKGKKVLDMCCFHGYLAQEISKEGGIVSACDVHNNATLTASIFAKWLDVNYKLYHCNVDVEFPEGPFDIILLFSALHHLKNQELVLEKISKRCQMAIFEINSRDKPLIQRWFKIEREIQSPKDDRLIIMGVPK